MCKYVPTDESKFQTGCLDLDQVVHNGNTEHWENRKRVMYKQGPLITENMLVYT